MQSPVAWLVCGILFCLICITTSAAQNSWSLEISATEGETVTLSCSTNSSRPAVGPIDWKFQPSERISDVYICLADKVVPGYVGRFQLDSTDLIVYNVSTDDTGIYHCIEDAAEGPRNIMYLNVMSKPTESGHSVTLSSPPPSGKSIPVNTDEPGNSPVLPVVITVVVLVAVLVFIAVVFWRRRVRRQMQTSTLRQKQQQRTKDSCECIELLQVTQDSNDQLKAKFRKLHENVASLDLTSVARRLLEEGILSDADYNKLNRHIRTRTKSNQLLETLHRSDNQEAFVRLRVALIEVPEIAWLVDRLDNLVLNDDETVNELHSKAFRVTSHTPGSGTVWPEQVWGVATIGHLLCILRSKDNNEIDVYDTTTCSRLYQLTVPRPRAIVDMTSCRQNACLYISDDLNDCIHRLDLYNNTQNWPVGDKPGCLSVGTHYNSGILSNSVLVTCPCSRKLKKFTIFGKLLCEIDLQSDIVNPCHAAELSNGHFAVCRGALGDQVHRVCIVDTSGVVLHSYIGHDSGLLNGPRHLAIDNDGFIFVADNNNSRVILLSLTLRYVRDAVSSGQLKYLPNRLHLDVDNRVLYVAEGIQTSSQITAVCV